MCGRFFQYSTWQEMHDAYSLIPGVPILKEAPSVRLDVRPTQTIDVLRNSIDGYEFAPKRWAFEPRWAKSPLINARPDKMAGRAWSKFSPAIVFVSGFYEWPQKIKGKRPDNYARYHFTITGKPVMPLAALWSPSQTKKGEQVDCVVIGTTAPNPLFEKLPHHRMAAILTNETIEPWMSSEPEDRESTLGPYPSQLMTG